MVKIYFICILLVSFRFKNMVHQAHSTLPYNVIEVGEEFKKLICHINIFLDSSLFPQVTLYSHQVSYDFIT